MLKRLAPLLSALLIFSLCTPLTAHASTSAPDSYIERYGEYAEETWWGELELLAIIVYAEAGNQDLEGKELVADVVLNRLDNPNYPDTIYDVIFQPGQFSTANEKTIIKAGRNITQDCYTAVLNELSDRNDSEVLFFCTGGYPRYGTPVYKHGDHYFSK